MEDSIETVWELEKGRVKRKVRRGGGGMIKGRQNVEKDA